MPYSAPRPCTYPGCGTLTTSSRCAKHKYTERRELDAKRGTRTARGYDNRWLRASKAYLRDHPLCQCPDCDEGRIRVRLSEVVDHRIPHRGDQALFWDEHNWQAMAKTCHDRKTAREDGAFGNAGRGGSNL